MWRSPKASLRQSSTATQHILQQRLIRNCSFSCRQSHARILRASLSSSSKALVGKHGRGQPIMHDFQYPFRLFSTTFAGDALENNNRLKNIEKNSIVGNQHNSKDKEASTSTLDENFPACLKILKSVTPEMARDDKVIEQTLEDSWNILQKQMKQESLEASLLLLESMQQALELWISMHFQSVTRPSTSRPFQILVQAWSLATRHTTSNNVTNEAAEQACEVLKRWYELLGGALDLCPAMADYNCVLESYANTAVILDAKAKDRPLTIDQQLMLDSLSSQSWDIVQELTSWGYTMTPTLESNAHLVRCLALTIAHTNNNNTDGAPNSAWNRLQIVMKDNVEPLIANLDRPATATNIFESTSNKQKAKKEMLYLAQTLCDALVAAHKAGVYQEAYTESYVETANQWTDWAKTFKSFFLDEPERLAQLMDYSISEMLPFAAHTESFTPSPIFHLLARGTQAWQSLLLQMGSHQYQEQPLLMGTLVEDALTCLENSRKSDDTDSPQTHQEFVGLLLNFLWTIKAWETETTHLQGKLKEEAMQRRDAILQRFQDQHYSLLYYFGRRDKLASSLRGRQQSKQSTSPEYEMSTVGDENLLLEQEIRHLKNAVVHSFNTLMQAKFEVGLVDDVFLLWRKMKEKKLPPNSQSYSVVLKSLADSTHPKAAETAHNVLQQLEEQESFEPTANQYASVLVAWSRSVNQDAAKMALQVFKQLQQQSEKSENFSDDCLGAPTRLGPVHYVATLKALARYRGPRKKFDLTILEFVKEVLKVYPSGFPDVALYTATMNALSKLGTRDAAILTQQLLDSMREQYIQKDIRMKPTVHKYGACIHAWSRAASLGEANDAPTIIGDLLDRLETDYNASGGDAAFRPNSYIYHGLINAEMAVGESNKAERVTEILDRMESKAAMGLAEQPNSIVYSKVIDALRKFGGGDCLQKCESIMDRMKAPGATDDPEETKAYLHAFCSFVQAWSRSLRGDKAARAHILLQKVQDEFLKSGNLLLKPNATMYVAMLHSCVHTPPSATPSDREAAIRIALQTLVDMETNGYKPSSFAYGLALQAITANERDTRERQALAAVLFGKCCRDGLVNAFVIGSLKQCAPALYHKIPGENNKKTLPRDWICKVEEGNRSKHGREK